MLCVGVLYSMLCHPGGTNPARVSCSGDDAHPPVFYLMSDLKDGQGERILVSVFTLNLGTTTSNTNVCCFKALVLHLGFTLDSPWEL